MNSPAAVPARETAVEIHSAAGVGDGNTAKPLCSQGGAVITGTERRIKAIAVNAVAAIT